MAPTEVPEVEEKGQLEYFPSKAEQKIFKSFGSPPPFGPVKKKPAMEVKIDAPEISSLEKCRNKMSHQERVDYLNKLLESQRSFARPSDDVYRDDNDICLASELLKIPNVEERKRFLSSVVSPRVLSWYNENISEPLETTELEEQLKDVDLGNPKLNELLFGMFNILQLFFLTGDRPNNFDEADRNHLQQYHTLDLSRHYISELINYLPPPVKPGSGPASNLVARLFALFTPEDLTRWMLDIRNVSMGKEKGIKLLPNRTGRGVYDKLAAHYASLVTLEDFQRLAGTLSTILQPAPPISIPSTHQATFQGPQWV